MRQHESNLRTDNYLLTAGLAVGALLVSAGIGYENGKDQVVSPKGAGLYCSDAPEDRARPLRVEHDMLIVGMHGECSGRADDIVGVYHKTVRSERAAKVFENNQEFAALCVSKGQDTKTSVYNTYEGPYNTSSDLWLTGFVPGSPDIGKVRVSYPDTGFVMLNLGTFTLKNC